MGVRGIGVVRNSTRISSSGCYIQVTERNRTYIGLLFLIIVCGWGVLVYFVRYVNVFTNEDQPINRVQDCLYNWRYTESDTEEKNQQYNNHGNKYSVALKTYSVLAAGLVHSVVQLRMVTTGHYE